MGEELMRPEMGDKRSSEEKKTQPREYLQYSEVGNAVLRKLMDRKEVLDRKAEAMGVNKTESFKKAAEAIRKEVEGILRLVEAASNMKHDPKDCSCCHERRIYDKYPSLLSPDANDWPSEGLDTIHHFRNSGNPDSIAQDLMWHKLFDPTS